MSKPKYNISLILITVELSVDFALLLASMYTFYIVNFGFVLTYCILFLFLYFNLMFYIVLLITKYLN
jgi:hypothetical protein